MQTKEIELNLLFKLLYLNSNLALTLCYFNPALNNPAETVTILVEDELGVPWVSERLFSHYKGLLIRVGSIDLFTDTAAILN